MIKGVAIAGNMVADTVKYIDFYPQKHHLTTIRTLSRSIGGLVCNCGVTLAKIDPDAAITAIGVVGNDADGEYLLAELAKHPSIDTSAIRRAGTTSFTDVMTEHGGGRTFFTFRGASDMLCPDDFDMDALSAKAGILHAGYALLMEGLDKPDPAYGTALAKVLMSARERGMITSIDVVSEDSDRYSDIVSPALAHTDICVINEIEAERVTGVPTRHCGGILSYEGMERAASRLVDMGVQRWAVIHAPEAATAAQRGGQCVTLHSWRLPEGFVKSSVGAGDAYAMGILYGVRRGWTLAQSMHAARSVAAYSLSGVGGTDSARPYDEIIDELTNIAVLEE